MKVKIIGAGSIGNHLAQASRRMGWDVDVVDKDRAALLRMKNEIYPQRYGEWDPAIGLFSSEHEPKGGYDIIMIGTPPDIRMKIAIEALKEKPRLLHLEKPLFAPSPESINAFREFKKTFDTLPFLSDSPIVPIVTVGYDHAVSKAAHFVKDLLLRGVIGEALNLHVAFKENWKGIFSAHPWLKSPEDSYLGYWRRGGGAGCEHSHALHLWLHFAKILGWSIAEKISSKMDMYTDGVVDYDKEAQFLITTSSGKIGQVVQDVVTDPPEKIVHIWGERGSIVWKVGWSPHGDLIMYPDPDSRGEIEYHVIAKNRQDDFYEEMKHYDALLKGEITPDNSPLSLSSGIEVMATLIQAYSFANNNKKS